MRKIFTIAGREIHSFFVTPLFYIVASGFTLLAGFFFFSLLLQFNTVIAQAQMGLDNNASLNHWVVNPLYQTLEVVLIFLVPIISMRTIAEERSNGTFELLMTSPVTPTELVWGKFLGQLVVMAALVAMVSVFPFVLIIQSDPEILPIFVGLLGLFLFSLALNAIGIAVSSFTKNQAIAGVISSVFFLMLYLIDAPAEKLSERWGELLHFLTPASHTEGFFKGVIDTPDLVYFVSVILLGLFVACRTLEAERWRG